MPDRQKLEAILVNRFPSAPLTQLAAAANAIMALQEDRPVRRGGAVPAAGVTRTTVAVSTHIRAPLTRVFDRFTDLDRAPQHVSGILALERLTEGPFGTGTRWRETRRILGRADSAEMAVTAFERYRGYTISHHKGGVRIETAFSFDAWAAGTVVAIEFALEDAGLPPSFLTPINWVIAGKVRHTLQADLADLKAGLEPAEH